jgi:NADPH:quinone reductase-like Zn-dependent oxidoreductase
MKLRYKIASGFLIFLSIAITALAMVLSHNSDCLPAPALSDSAATMQAVSYRCYGSTDVLEYGESERPTPADDEVLVKVVAASVNPLDWHYMRGTPYIMRLMGAGIGAPIDSRVGVDFAGTVADVGASVTRFEIGDPVFGGRSGAFAEYLVIPEDRALAIKPAAVSFDQAASVGIAGITALQALRDKGKLEAGQTVLINGASGGVGTFAVQIAKSMGAEVTGVCSTRNVEMVRSIGADHVIDYKLESYTENEEQYDLILDMVGNHSLQANRKVLKADGRLILVGGAKGDWLGPLMAPIKAALLSPFVDHELVMLLATLRQDDLTVLGELMQSGDLVPVIDRHFTLQDVREAMQYSESGRARGKIIVDVSSPEPTPY